MGLRMHRRGSASRPMNNFNDLSALRSTLQDLYHKGPLDPEKRRGVFVDFLEQQLDFTKDQASLYAATVLTRNAEGSADWVGSAALKIFGTWIRITQEGMAAALLTSLTETWRFTDDLMCEHKLEKYEGYSSPFGASYSLPSLSSEGFVWAPSDSCSENLDVVVVPLDAGIARTLKFIWLDEEIFPRKCSINGDTFVKQ
jgi:hypothetical protein